MKTMFLIIIVVIIIASSIVFVIVWNYNSANLECDKECEIERRRIGSGQEIHSVFESQLKEEHYQIEIIGMKNIYRIGEQYDFSYVISGYGHSCGNKEITFPDQNGDVVKIISNSSCITNAPMKEFIIDSKKEYDTTSLHGKINTPGIYHVTITFDRPSKNFPTMTIKEFRVLPINSWYNNQLNDASLPTVMDSCTYDSPKERMTNALRYTNGTHVFSNLGCEWKKIGEFVGE